MCYCSLCRIALCGPKSFLFFHHTIREKCSQNIPSQIRGTFPPPKNRRACWATPSLTARPLYVRPLLSSRRWDVSLENLSTTRVYNCLTLIRRWTEATEVFNFTCLTSEELKNESCCYHVSSRYLRGKIAGNNNEVLKTCKMWIKHIHSKMNWLYLGMLTVNWLLINLRLFNNLHPLF